MTGRYKGSCPKKLTFLADMSNVHIKGGGWQNPCQLRKCKCLNTNEEKMYIFSHYVL